MEIILITATICIFIEVWHIIYYSFLYKKYFKRAEKVMMCAHAYEKLNEYFKIWCDYCKDSPEVLESLGLDKTSEALMYNDINKTGIMNRILNTCSIKELSLYLLEQAIELIYYILVFILALFLPGINGLVLFFILITLSNLQKHYNKDKNVFYLNIDSLLCIGMFILVIFSYT